MCGILHLNRCVNLISHCTWEKWVLFLASLQPTLVIFCLKLFYLFGIHTATFRCCFYCLRFAAEWGWFEGMLYYIIPLLSQMLNSSDICVWIYVVFMQGCSLSDVELSSVPARLSLQSQTSFFTSDLHAGSEPYSLCPALLFPLLSSCFSPALSRFSTSLALQHLLRFVLLSQSGAQIWLDLTGPAEERGDNFLSFYVQPWRESTAANQRNRVFKNPPAISHCGSPAAAQEMALQRFCSHAHSFLFTCKYH